MGLRGLQLGLRALSDSPGFKEQKCHILSWVQPLPVVRLTWGRSCLKAHTQISGGWCWFCISRTFCSGFIARWTSLHSHSSVNVVKWLHISLNFSENVCKWALGVEGLTLVGPGTKKFKKHWSRESPGRSWHHQCPTSDNTVCGFIHMCSSSFTTTRQD